MTDSILIRGAAEHNLANVSVEIPRNVLAVITGLSGSGKSSLAYDIIYREGQRRFVESLSSYARQYLGRMDKPRVEHIEGLSPTISIDQKTISRNPRSTVGTITEILDHLRLLFARLGEPHCPECGELIESRTVDQIVDACYFRWPDADVMVTAPIVLDRKGEYRKELDELREQGFVRVRVDGEVRRLDEKIELARYERHTIEVIYDRLRIEPRRRGRLSEAIENALLVGDGLTNLVVDGEDHLQSSRFACPRCDVNLPELEPRLFSFNSPHGACPHCDGLGRARTIDLDRLIPDPRLSLRDGAFATTSKNGHLIHAKISLRDLERMGAELGFDIDTPWRELSKATRDLLLFGKPTSKTSKSKGCKKTSSRSRAELRKERYQSRRARMKNYTGIVPTMEASYRESASRHLAKWFTFGECHECSGSRLRPEARSVLFRKRTIAEYSTMNVDEARMAFTTIRFDERELAVGEALLREIRHRLDFMGKVGLGYLELDRSADTLSGGEAQRIRLASQLGSGLRGVLYVLDEPSIGLHARDNQALLETLKRLRDLGNSVLVVEHDEETIEAADFVVDIGPAAGVHGGRLMHAGSVAALRRVPESLTGAYLSGRRQIAVPDERRDADLGAITLFGCRQHNLQGIDARFPLGRFIAVTGVSGSGKSTLVAETLYPVVAEQLGLQVERCGRHDSVTGLEAIDKIIEVSQSPIGRTPRSNPGTYTKVFDEIRELYARTTEARVRGYDKGRFSFNVKGGRCESCGGAGVNVIEMQFLADVEVVCEECDGRRYNRETLEITYRGHSIFDVLDLPIEEACEFFRDHPRIHSTLETLVDVGLGYVKLGQPSTTLSGGEAQRVKLAHELRKSATGRTLYVLDEPTTGLHFDDIQRLLATLSRLVDNGNTVVVIEHNLDVIKAADYLIDLGPEGGAGGGRIIATGTPEDVAAGDGATALALRDVLAKAKAGRRAAKKTKKRASKKKRQSRRDPKDRFIISGARENNLKNITIEIPRDKLTVVTGPSGSGKSTLAFDILFAEGQRRYVESLSTYARRFLGRMQRADVDRVEGIAPAIAIDQKNRSSSPRSTVATSTEIYDYLRLLFARVGRAHCVECGVRLVSKTPSAAARAVAKEFGAEPSYVLAPLFVPGEPEHRFAAADEFLVSVDELRREGFLRVRIDDRIERLDDFVGDDRGSAPTAPPPKAESSIYLVIDRLKPNSVAASRLAESIEEAYRQGRGRLIVESRDGSRRVHFTQLPSCPHGHFIQSAPLTPRLFSFNHHSGACPSCHGLGVRRELDPERLFTDASLPPFEGAMDHSLGRWIARPKGRVYKVVKKAFEEHGLDFSRPLDKYTKKMAKLLYDGTGDRVYRVRFKSMVRGMQYQATWEGLREMLAEWHRKAGSPRWRRAIEERMSASPCSACGGGRLRPDLLQVRIGKRSIAEVCAMTIRDARGFFDELPLTKREGVIAEEVLREIQNRLHFLGDVGLDYVGMDRSTESLSGGEAQRIRLATQIGNHLVGVLYVLDEPTIGLHQRDNERLLASLTRLRDLGNSIVVVEHDEQTIGVADHVIDLGPGAGKFGGEVVAAGTPAQIRRSRRSLTGSYLTGRRGVAVPTERRPGDGGEIVVRGARHNNLQGIDVSFPCGALSVVTGVSGSGKSSLVMDILARATSLHFSDARVVVGEHEEIVGLDAFDSFRLIDQAPIGRNPGSNPATYTKLFTDLRALFARVPEARARGYGKGRFSFNVAGGRCEHCEGKGAILIEMHFLSDVWLECEVCKGKRYNNETLAIRYRGLNIADVMALDITAAYELFEHHPKLSGMLGVLCDVGLGYLSLGQSATTLSGGEAQRIKLAAELGKNTSGRTLYILDEPTTGLHFADVEKLIDVLLRLVDRGDTVIVIEHNLDLVKCADYVVDLGPEGGDGGGRLVAAGTPEQIACVTASHTGRFLRERLGVPARPKRRRAQARLRSIGATAIDGDRGECHSS